MSGAIPPLAQYAFIVWCSVTKKAQEQLYLSREVGWEGVDSIDLSQDRDQ
jgi:hypothetical protein